MKTYEVTYDDNKKKVIKSSSHRKAAVEFAKWHDIHGSYDSDPIYQEVPKTVTVRNIRNPKDKGRKVRINGWMAPTYEAQFLKK